MDPEYLRSLDERYRWLFHHFDEAPVLSVDTTNVDFRKASCVDALIEAINSGATGPLTITSREDRG